MRTISKYFLTLHTNDKIEAIHQLFAQVLSKNNRGQSQTPDLRGLIVDANGILKGFQHEKDHRIFVKMCYPALQFILGQFIEGYVNDGFFVCYLLGKNPRGSFAVNWRFLLDFDHIFYGRYRAQVHQ